MPNITPYASFPDLSLAPVAVSVGRHLPRWEANGAVYHVALHLADSVPQEQLAIWREERARLSALAQAAKRPLSADEVEALRAVYNDRVEKYLSAGCGACLLRDPRAAEALESVLAYGNGEKYALHLFCIMPNHLHVIVGGFDETCPLRDVLTSWKGASAHRVNRVLGRKGEVWQGDAYTRIIRSREEYVRQLNYVWCNPEAAGIRDGFLRKRFVQW